MTVPVVDESPDALRQALADYAVQESAPLLHAAHAIDHRSVPTEAGVRLDEVHQDLQLGLLPDVK